MIKTLKICQVTTGVTFSAMQNSIHSCRNFYDFIYFFPLPIWLWKITNLFYRDLEKARVPDNFTNILWMAHKKTISIVLTKIVLRNKEKNVLLTKLQGMYLPGWPQTHGRPYLRMLYVYSHNLCRPFSKNLYTLYTGVLGCYRLSAVQQ